LEPGDTLNMISAEDRPSFLYWARNWNLGIRGRSYGFWKGT